VNNGTEAIAEVQKGGYEVGGIDLKMPGINGKELLNLMNLPAASRRVSRIL